MSESDVIYRETALCRFPDPEDRETLQRFGSMVLSWASSAEHFEAGRSTMTASALAAAAADLRHLSVYLRAVADEVEGSVVEAAEATLGKQAKTWARETADLALEIGHRVEESEIEDDLEPAGESDRLDKLTEGVRKLLAEARKLRSEAADGAVGQLVGHLKDDLEGLEAEPEAEP